MRVHVRSSPPLLLRSGSYNFIYATVVKAQGRGLSVAAAEHGGQSVRLSPLIELN